MVSLVTQKPDVGAPNVSTPNLVDETATVRGLDNLGETYGRAVSGRNRAEANMEAAKAEAAGISIAENQPIGTNQSAFDVLKEEFGEPTLTEMGFFVKRDAAVEVGRLDAAERQGTLSNLNDLRRNILMRQAIARNPFFARELYAQYKEADGKTTNALNLLTEQTETKIAEAQRDAELKVIQEFDINTGDPLTDRLRARSIMSQQAYLKTITLGNEIGQQEFTRETQDASLGAKFREEQALYLWRETSGIQLNLATQKMASVIDRALADAQANGTPLDITAFRNDMANAQVSIATNLAAKNGIDVATVQAALNPYMELLTSRMDATALGSDLKDQAAMLEAQSNMIQYSNDILTRRDMSELLKIPGAPRAINWIKITKGMDPLMSARIESRLANEGIKLDVEEFLIRAMSPGFVEVQKGKSFKDTAIEMGYTPEKAEKIASTSLANLNDMLSVIPTEGLEGISGSTTSFNGQPVSNLSDLTIKIMKAVNSEDQEDLTPEYYNEIARFFGNPNVANQVIGAIAVIDRKAADNLVGGMQRNYEHLLRNLQEDSSNIIMVRNVGAARTSDYRVVDANPKILGSLFGINITSGLPGTAERLRADSNNISAAEFLETDVDENGNISFKPIAEYADRAVAIQAGRDLTMAYSKTYGHLVRGFAHIVEGSTDYQGAGLNMMAAGGFKPTPATKEQRQAAATARAEAVRQNMREELRAAHPDWNDKDIEDVLGGD